LVNRVALQQDDDEPAPPSVQSGSSGLSVAASAKGGRDASASAAARVAITRIASHSGVSKQSVRGALNLDAITDCYRSAISAGSIADSQLTGELELATSQSGSVTEASLTAPGLPAPVRRCVEQIVRRGRVREADTGNAQATISLAFLPR
jgi:hypothetical protein